VSPNPTTPAPEAALSPADAAREARRAQRLAVLDVLCDRNLRAVEDLTDYMAGELPEDKARVFAGIQDPCLALSRLSRTIGQIVALQERLDEDGETRERRLKDEQDARDRKAAAEAATRRAQQAESEAQAERDRVRKRKNIVQHAIEMAIEAEVEPQYAENALIAMDERIRAFEEYSDFGDGTIGEIVAKFCRDMGLTYDPELWEDEPWAIAEAAAAEAASEDEDAPELGADDVVVAAVRPQAVGNGHDPP